ncbi:putative ribosomal N-acetyltransferase YdaF [Methanobrevibacter cuticularis]|uniref:Putative ribosomal N-acetyltransferase YdaF n=1 Tax=Methanobrevibacter cuticularis TaxID=47311 RepID=A0A166EBN1_9EURY|nr:GNAT family N-acetyltransferase [Methanobrevibacter cuticularis]KZX16481.1 putative ribosomal N-acetyltransferase YdaF [Methanobrevibacter cuticularis]
MRKLNKGDSNSLTKHANNYNIAKFLTNEFPHPYSISDAKKFIEMTYQEFPMRTFGIEINGEIAGVISVVPISDNKSRIVGELGYWLSEDYWNNGITTLAIKKIVKYAFKTFKFDYILANPFVDNLASQKVLKKVGFKLKSKNSQNIIKNKIVHEVLIFCIVP